MSPNKLLLKLALEYPWLIVANVLLSFSGAFFNGISTALIIPLVLGLLNNNPIDSSGLPSIIKKLFSIFDIFPEGQRWTAMIVSVVLLIILKSATNYISTVVGGHLKRCLNTNLRLRAIRLLLDVDWDFFCKQKIGELDHQIIGEINRTISSLSSAIAIFTTSLTILTFIWILLWLSWPLTVIVTVLLAILMFLNRFFTQLSRKYGYLLSRASGAFTSQFIEMLSGIRLIKTVSTEEEEYEKIKEKIRNLEQAMFRSQNVSSVIGPINEISGILIVLSIIIIGKFLFAEQLQSIATLLLVYLAILFRLLPVIGSFSSSRNQFAGTSPSVEQLADFLRRDNKPFMVKNHQPYTKLEKGIRFENVSFQYPEHEKVVLKNIDLWIPKGKTVALVGASGSGKSTMADLLARFYDPVEGKITLDGKDLREFEIKSLRGAMGIVSQDTFLFNNTISYNIAYGVNNVREEDIIEAAKRANAYEFIIKLTKGFDTEIGDRGVILSGGQKQRMAIARALLRNPEILILDEATSALDTISERLVQKAIDELCQDRTTLVIAHRLSTVQKAYQIVVLDRGEIVEIGNHQELLQKGSYYSRLYNMQFTDRAS
jgi:subfamily B ATP-binding cassette protein MsbA